MQNIKLTGHSLIEVLMALLIISIIWLTLENLIQKSMVRNFANETKIIDLFLKKSVHENAMAACYLNKVFQCPK